MRLYIIPFVFSALVCFGCSRGSPHSEIVSDPQELDRLKGTWQVIDIVAAGRQVPADRVQSINLQYILDGDNVTIRRFGRPDDRLTFSVDSGANPKKMTINGSPTIRAIYALEGTQLRLCLMVDENLNAGFPTSLASGTSPKTDLLTLERREPQVQGPGKVGAAKEMYVYSQSTGKLTLNDQLVCIGYSGQGAAKNDHAKQSVKDGPIPVGEYVLVGFRDDAKLGGKIMGLMPLATTNYFKRFPFETFAIIADTANPPSGCFIVVARDVLGKLGTPNSKLRVVK